MLHLLYMIYSWSETTEQWDLKCLIRQTNKVTYYWLSWNWAANIFAILSVSFFLDDGDMLRCCLGPLCGVGKVCNYKDQNKNKTDVQLYLTNKAQRLKHLRGMAKNSMFTGDCTQQFLQLLFMWTSRLLHDIKNMLKPVLQEHLPASTCTSTPTQFADVLPLPLFWKWFQQDLCE